MGRDSTPGADFSMLLPGVNATTLVQSSNKTELSIDASLVGANFTLTAITPEVNEGGTATFNITASGPLSSATTLYFSTKKSVTSPPPSSTTSLEFPDYTEIINRPITFNLTDSRTQTISVQVLADNVVEGQETFQGVLSLTPLSLASGTSVVPPVLVNIKDSALATAKTGVFLPSAGYVSLNSPQVRTYGSTGDDTVVLSANSSAVVLDQAIERVFLPAKSGDYKFLRSGNQLSVFDSNGTTLVLKTPLQSDANGTELVFSGDITSATSKAAASATLINGAMKIAGVTVPSDTSAAMSWTTAAAILPTKVMPSGPVAAMVFVAQDSGFSVVSSGMQLFGSMGMDTVTIPNSMGVTGLVVDQLVDNINLDAALLNYSFMQMGNQLNIYPSKATQPSNPIVNLTVQGDNDGTQLLFSGKSYSVKLLPGGVMKLGDKTIATDKPTPIEMGTLVKVGSSGKYSAELDDIRFEITDGAFEYLINGFGPGDTLIFPAGSEPSLFNDRYNDQSVVLEWGVSGKIMRLTFTDISNDDQLNSVSDFNTVFGSGTFSFPSAPVTPVPPVAPTTPTNRSIAINAGNTTAFAESKDTNTTFTVATVASNYTYTIAGFGAGDKIVSPSGITPTFPNTNFTDGIATLQYASGNFKVWVTLTGLTTAQDALLTTKLAFDTMFGANTLT